MRFHLGFSFNWKTIKKWLIPLLVGVLLLFSQKLSVYAIDCYGYFDSGASLKGMSKIGSQWVGDNYYYSFNQNTEEQSLLDVCFATKSDIYSGSTNKIYFTVDYCVNANHVPKLSVYSSYYNSVDYTYDLGYKRYLTNADWSNSGCFRSFISLNMLTDNYSDTATGEYISEIQDNNNNFALLNDFGYGGILRYTDLVYYNANDYAAKLIEAKNLNNNNTIVSQNQTIINQNETINNSINDINDSITDPGIASGTSGSAYFGDNVWQKNYGLSSLLTIPIDLINSITTKTCSPLVLNLPFLTNKSITLPCVSSLIQTNFQTLFDLYQLIMGGFICYNCALHIYKDVENALDPESNMSVSGYFV